MIDLTKTAVTWAAAGLVAVGVTAGGCGKGSPLSPESLGGAFGGQQGAQLGKAFGTGAEAAAMGEKDEDDLGQGVGLKAIAQYGLVRDQALTRYVNLVGLTVVSTSERAGGNWVFGVLDSSDVNAFAGPNGYIFITRGLLATVQNEAELAGVLAHEAAHVIQKHGLQAVQRAKSSQAVGEAIKSNDQVAQFGALTDAGTDVILKNGYSKPQELTSDALAIRLLADSGYDPAAYVAFLKRNEQRSTTAGLGAVMSTHPGGADRIARAEAELAKVKKKGGQVLADRFKKNVTPAASGAL